MGSVNYFHMTWLKHQNISIRLNNLALQEKNPIFFIFPISHRENEMPTTTNTFVNAHYQWRFHHLLNNTKFLILRPQCNASQKYTNHIQQMINTEIFELKLKCVWEAKAKKREEIPYSGNPNSFEAAKMKVEERVESRVWKWIGVEEWDGVGNDTVFILEQNHVVFCLRKRRRQCFGVTTGRTGVICIRRSWFIKSFKIKNKKSGVGK